MDTLKDVFCTALNVPSIREDDGPNQISSWDSFAHVVLISAIEENFGVALTSDEASNMRSIAECRQILANYGIEIPQLEGTDVSQ